MPSENITIRSGINPSKFMGSAHAAGSSLEERVGNNERKITLLKNIINYKDSLLPIPKPEESDNTNLNISDRLNNIGEALGVIGGLFKIQLSSLQDKEEKDSQDKAEEDKKAREAELEAKKATKSKPDSKLKIPKLGFFETLKKFFLNVALGAASLKLIEWFKNPENREKILSFTNFLKDNAKAIFTTLAALVALNIAASLAGTIATLKIVAGLLLNPWVLFFLGIASSGILFDKALKKIINWYEDPNHPERNSVGGLVPGAPKNAQVNDWFIDKNGQVWQKMEFDSSNGGWQKIDRVPTPRMLEMREKWVEKGVIKRVGEQLEAEYAKGGRPPVGEVVSVGERGRELFVADTSGTIISNDKTEHVFDGGALLVAKSSTMDKVSSISQRVDRKRTPNLIDLRGKSGGSSSNPTFTTGDQLSSVPSEDSSNIDLVSGSLVYGLVG
mgnify:FL=1|tara:strand:- start:2912 stop:4243 length:1332 start_codon:yes stop_codon:yes gene_type:complete